MRILIVADVPENPDSGAAGTEHQTARALRGLGHEVDCVWSDAMPRRIAHGNLHYLLELPRAYRGVIRNACRTKAYDVIHVNQPHCWLAARDHRRQGRQGVFVQRSHGWEPRVNEIVAEWRHRWGMREKQGFARLLSGALRKLLGRHNELAVRYCDGTIVSATACAEYIVARHGVRRDRVATIPQAAPAGYLESRPPPLNDERGRHVLYVGQCAFFKAPSVVAGAMRLLASRNPLLDFVWVCDEADHAHVRQLLGDAAERCHLSTWMPQQDLLRVYDSCGVFLFPSLAEGFGKAFIEAMSRGLAVVASSEGGMRDVIRHGHDGLLVPVGDTLALANLASLLTEDRELRAQVGSAARRTAETYTWDRVARETIAAYRRFAAVRARSREA